MPLLEAGNMPKLPKHPKPATEAPIASDDEQQGEYDPMFWAAVEGCARAPPPPPPLPTRCWSRMPLAMLPGLVPPPRPPPRRRGQSAAPT